jgi:hypothetical protein
MDRAIDQYLQRYAEPEAQQFCAADHPALNRRVSYPVCSAAVATQTC